MGGFAEHRCGLSGLGFDCPSCAATGASASRPTAGDLLIAAVDKWASHAMRCDLDECEPCVAAINQLRLAYKVWQSSAHKAAT